MKPIKHVLVATDFGETAADALAMGESIAKQFDAKLTLVHAVHVPYLMYGSGPYVPADDVMPRAQETLEAEFQTAKQRYPRAERLLASGDPRTRIPELALELKTDLIVMGTHGRRGLSHVLMGSVAERVVQTSKVPVLTVPGTKASS